MSGDFSPGQPPHRRRKRYTGTHPRRFEEKYKEHQPERFPDMQEHVRAQGRTPAGSHVPVLLAAVMEALAPLPGDIVADCTLGFGGHARALLERVGPTGRLIGLDRDAAELSRTAKRLADAGYANISTQHAHFAGLAKALRRDGIAAVDIVLADLGVSSMQLDDPRRGFSYKSDGPLDMRLDPTNGATAADWLAEASEADLAAALESLSDEPDAAAIARTIVEARRRRPLRRTGELVDVVLRAKGLDPRSWRDEPEATDGAPHPAARTFQAVRMVVNDELAGLAQFLRTAPYCLRPGGRIGVISFHSGEDERVATAFAAGLAGGLFAAIATDPILPDAAERRDNPRSRSARFRWARRAAD